MPQTSSASDAPTQQRQLHDLPPALPVAELLGKDPGHRFAVFLDYDGTLTPIVDDPDDALLSESMRTAVSQLADVALVAIVSGRDLKDVRAKVGIDGLAYAGSHGFDLRHPDGSSEQVAVEALEHLDAAEDTLAERVGAIDGARIERKRFAIAVHDRGVEDPAQRERLAEIVAEVGHAYEGLRSTGGKRIHELRPDIDWDKGRAIETLLEVLDAGEHVPIYVGDDLTDEDGFRAVTARDGVGVVVRGEGDDRATLAAAALESPEHTEQLLTELADLARRGAHDRHDDEVGS